MALKKKKDVASITAEINADVDNNVATETVVTEPVAETVLKRRLRLLQIYLRRRRKS